MAQFAQAIMLWFYRIKQGKYWLLFYTCTPPLRGTTQGMMCSLSTNIHWWLNYTQLNSSDETLSFIHATVNVHTIKWLQRKYYNMICFVNKLNQIGPPAILARHMLSKSIEHKRL